MSGTRKTFLTLLGSLSAILAVVQLVLGQLIIGGRADLIKAHQHSGYMTVAFALAYIAASLAAIAS